MHRFILTMNGLKVLDLPIDLYIGRARVIDVSGNESIGRAELEDIDFGGAERILLKTGSRPDPTVFPERFHVFTCGYRSFIERARGSSYRCRYAVG